MSKIIATLLLFFVLINSNAQGFSLINGIKKAYFNTYKGSKRASLGESNCHEKIKFQRQNYYTGYFKGDRFDAFDVILEGSNLKRGFVLKASDDEKLKWSKVFSSKNGNCETRAILNYQGNIIVGVTLREDSYLNDEYIEETLYEKKRYNFLYAFRPNGTIAWKVEFDDFEPHTVQSQNEIIYLYGVDYTEKSKIIALNNKGEELFVVKEGIYRSFYNHGSKNVISFALKFYPNGTFITMHSENDRKAEVSTVEFNIYDANGVHLQKHTPVKGKGNRVFSREFKFTKDGSLLMGLSYKEKIKICNEVTLKSPLGMNGALVKLTPDFEYVKHKNFTLAKQTEGFVDLPYFYLDEENGTINLTFYYKGRLMDKDKKLLISNNPGRYVSTTHHVMREDFFDLKNQIEKKDEVFDVYITSNTKASKWYQSKYNSSKLNFSSSNSSSKICSINGNLKDHLKSDQDLKNYVQTKIKIIEKNLLAGIDQEYEMCFFKMHQLGEYYDFKSFLKKLELKQPYLANVLRERYNEI